ncbi:glucose-6-phosphate exchanger SLC37A4-like [Amblyomma americanum]
MQLRGYQKMIFATLFFGYGIYGYNRKCVPFVLPALVASGLRRDEAGMILSSHNLAFAGSKFLCGVLSDSVSSRLLFVTGLFSAAGFTFTLAASSVSAYPFAALWFLDGCSQGCGWPAIVKVLQQWFSQAQFGTLYGVLASSCNIALTIAPFLSSYLMLTYSWRASVIATGVLCLLMGCISLFTMVNKPTDVGLVLSENRQLSPSHRDADSHPEKEAPLGTPGCGQGPTEEGANTVNLLASPFIWLLSAAYLTVFFARAGAVDWGQLYLIEDLKQSQFTASAFMSCIECGGFLGGIVAGYITDWLIVWYAKKGDTSGASPRVPVSVVLVSGATVAFHIFGYSITEHSSELLISIIGLALGACLYGSMAIFGVVASECVPVHLSGTSHAIVAFGGSLGGVMSGLPLSLVAEHYGWPAVFFLLEVVSAFTALALFAGMNFDTRVRARAAAPTANSNVVAVAVPSDVETNLEAAPSAQAQLAEPS